MQSLSGSDFAVGEWVEFHNLTKLYKLLLETAHKKEVRVLQTRFVVSSQSCPGLSPSRLGFGSVSENRTQFMGFEEDQDRDQFRFSRVMSLIAKAHVRSRRQVTYLNSVTEAPTTASTPSPLSTSTPLANPEDYNQRRCQLYHHEINFANVGLKP